MNLNIFIHQNNISSKKTKIETKKLKRSSDLFNQRVTF